VGETLSQWTGLPLLLDFRDEWTLNSAYSENRLVDPISRHLQGYLQRRVMRSAQCLLATTRSSARALEALREQAGSTARVAWIYNGFDADDFPPQPPPVNGPPTTYRLAYVGTLWKLTSVAPLVRAVQHFAQRWPALAGRLELVFAGRRTHEQQRLVHSLRGLPCRVIEHPYLDHREAIELIRSAHGLCVLLTDLPGAERVVPAKTFEYLAARRRILAIAPPGEVTDLLATYPDARVFSPGDVKGVANYLAKEFERGDQGRGTDARGWDLAPYERRSQAGELAQILNALTRPPKQSS
jgi:glycosyltransferase involved in cell wall biosynthesis